LLTCIMKMFFGPAPVYLVAGLLLSISAHAEIKLNGLFTDGAVLQQNRDIPVWGTGRDGEKVVVKLAGEESSTTVKNGRWMVKLKPLKAGGPFTLAIVADNAITLTNVLIGEVWLCSGQSNMGFQLYRAANAAEAIAAANDPELRLFTVPHGAKDEPERDVSGQWRASASATASNFSAVAYFFGRDLRRALKVPVGLIDSSVGGTPAEAWTPREGLEKTPELRKILESHAESVRNYDPAKAKESYDRAAKKHAEAVKAARAEGKPAPRAPAKPADPARASKRPSCLYNAMIAPLEPYALAGTIWYQGEANSGRAAEYEVLFPAMIKSWRKAWDQGDFPFLFVQIAPNDRMSPEIREAQLHTWQKVPKTAMTVTVDVGEATDIHPKKKEPVGHRLALAARAIAYGEKIEYSGPVFEKMSVEGDRAILSFSHVGSGLVAKDGVLKGFTISADNKVFVPANTCIKGDKVEVSGKEISKPVAVRYGWDNVPDVSLFNKEGLPATPFRTHSH
jgi:sialate O-acetylesterase